MRFKNGDLTIFEWILEDLKKFPFFSKVRILERRNLENVCSTFSKNLCGVGSARDRGACKILSKSKSTSLRTVVLCILRSDSIVFPEWMVEEIKKFVFSLKIRILEREFERFVQVKNILYFAGARIGY